MSRKKKIKAGPIGGLLLLGSLVACVLLVIKVAEMLELGSVFTVLVPFVVSFVYGSALVYLFEDFEFD